MATSPTSPSVNPNAFPRHEKCHPNGGVSLKDDPDRQVNVRSVILNLIKSVGSKLKEGKILDLLKVSRPAMISYPKTYLQCVADDLVYTELLEKAVAATSPISRMKYLIAYYIAGLHRNCCEMGSNGPLNPILGETYVAEKNDGTKLYCEQISHHPPISAYYMTNNNGDYKLYGNGEVNAKLSGMNSIEGKRVGNNYIEFKDGCKIKVENPEVIIEGLVMGDRTMNHHRSFCFIDEGNHLLAEVKFDYSTKGAMSKIASGFKGLFSSKEKEAVKPMNDSFSLIIYNTEGEKQELLTGSGSWLSYIEIGGEVLWTMDHEVAEPWSPEPQNKLDSDSSVRLDSKCIQLKKWDLAQKEKESLENRQRDDAKLRKPANIKAGDKNAKVAGKSLG